MDVKEELRKLEQRRQNYLSIVQDSGRKRSEREMAQGDLEMVETKLAELRKRMSTENDEPLCDIGGNRSRHGHLRSRSGLAIIVGASGLSLSDPGP
jgi:hypothetical protein